MKPKVLIGEDSQTVLNLLCRLFRSLGFEAEGVSDGGELYKRAVACPPDAIVADYHMPVMDGLSLLRALRRKSQVRHVPVFLLSGASDGSIVRKALAAGAAGFFQKPGDMNRLARAVRDVLAHSDGDSSSGP